MGKSEVDECPDQSIRRFDGGAPDNPIVPGGLWLGTKQGRRIAQRCSADGMSALLQGEVTDYGRLIILGMAVAHQDHLNQMSASESEHEVEERPDGV